MLYFAYGSNLDSKHWCSWCRTHGFNSAGLVPWRRGFLPDHELLFRLRSRRWGGGAADVGPRVGAAVPGVIFHTDGEAMRALDAKEGAGSVYERVHLPVLDDLGDLHEVTTYRVLDSLRTTGLKPSEGYRSTIVRGLREHGLPEEPLVKAIRGDRSQPTPEVVFVYGSLLRDQQSHHLLADHDSECLGSASTLGSLYDLGDYPGLVKSEGTVYGELYRLRDDRAVLALDEWEAFHGYHSRGYDGVGKHGVAYKRGDSMYRRVIGEVRIGDRRRWAWLYRYLGDVRGATRIDSGDWRDVARTGRS